MLMLEVLLTIVMFISGVALIKHNDKKTRNKSGTLEDWENTNRDLEWHLYLLAAGCKQYEDGRPVNPHIKYFPEALWVVNEQLKEKGLRLTPPWRKKFMEFDGLYDENGLCPLNDHYSRK